MVLNTLLLTGALTLSNCQSTSEANKLKTYKEKSVECIFNSIDVFNLENSLTLDENFSIIKQKLLKYHEASLNDEEIDSIKDEILSDNSYYEIDNLDKFEFKECSNELVTKYKQSLFAFDNSSSDYFSNNDIYSTSQEFPVKNNKYISNRFHKYENPYGDSENVEFPIRTVDETCIKYSTNDYLNSYAFIGLKCSKEFCISFYNLIANWGTSQIRNNVSGISSPMKSFYNSLMQLTKLSTIDLTAISSTITFIADIFSSIWSTFVVVFTSHDVISMIIGAILVLIGIIIIMILANIFVFGFMEMRFVFGWEIYPIFNPKFVREKLL